MAIFRTVKLSELENQNVNLLDEADKLREQLLIREMLEGNDAEEDILKIKELGVLKTLVHNKKLKIAQSGLIDDFMELNTKGYNKRQKNQIKIGLIYGINVNPYLKRYFDDEQMSEIRAGIEDGYDYEIYAKKEFDSDQMFQIRLCMEQGIDVSLIADPSIDSMDMLEIKDKIIEAKEKGEAFNISEIIDQVLLH